MANPTGGEYISYLDEVRVTIKDATEEVLQAVAFQIEAYAKVNIQANGQIDTGFMLNSVYVVHRQSSGFGAAKSVAQSKTISRKTGETVDKSKAMSPEYQLEPKFAAAVIVGANYAIYQELGQPFLFPAGEQAARDAGGVAEQIYRERVND